MKCEGTHLISQQFFGSTWCVRILSYIFCVGEVYSSDWMIERHHVHVLSCLVIVKKPGSTGRKCIFFSSNCSFKLTLTLQGLYFLTVRLVLRSKTILHMHCEMTVGTMISFKMRAGQLKWGGQKPPAVLVLAAMMVQVLVIICPTPLRPLSVCDCVCCMIIKSACRGRIREWNIMSAITQRTLV